MKYDTIYAGVFDHKERSRLGAIASRIDKRYAKEDAKSRHAAIRAERRRKRKAFQARKVDAYETRIPEATRRANNWLHFCGVSKR